MRKLLIFLIGFLVIIVVVAMVMKNQGVIGSPPATEVAVSEVESREIMETVSASGKVYPQTEVKISADVSGEIIQLYIDEGDSVVAGQLLLEVNPDIYESMLSRAEAALNQVKAGEASAQATLMQSTAQFDKAAIDYNRSKELHGKGIISDSEFEAAESTYKTAQANKESAVQNLNAARFNVKSAVATVKEARDNLAKTQIYAPIGGIISALNVEQGERVVGTAQMAGTELLRIADLNNMEAQVEVSENNVLSVSLGDTAEIEIDAYIDRKFLGVVSEIAYSSGSNNLMSNEQVTNFTVKIKLLRESYADLIQPEKGHRYPFRPGMSAAVEIQTERIIDALSVPIQAVTTREITDTTGEESSIEEVVFMVRDDRVHMIKVETGIQDDSYIQIVDGLLSTESVVVSAPFSAISRSLEHGSHVETVTESELFEGD